MKKLKTTAELKDDKPKKSMEVCPKCGKLQTWRGPHYEAARDVVEIRRDHPSKVKRVITKLPEHLVWACSVCGYQRLSPTKDSQ